ncbi:DUF1048 domain-containing protein [Lactococcus allomyrinae]|uniref:DUF1048 domain-containing protein n=1 Tax=Lactococcus allomyrinae TaxID=2419773 RepID=A0A387BJI6_9LACT|nr:DUF1048 domain-containing protein [Lactococcus allomyrinae]AYG01090.1 DUF1048 domain-containing protein [Lactococcus allomyrinae]
MALGDKIFGELAEKKEWNALQKRAKALPADFYKTYKAIQKYLFNMGLSDWRIFYEILDLLELASLDGQTVKEVIGTDVAAFADNFIDDKKQDWHEKYRHELNQYFNQNQR